MIVSRQDKDYTLSELIIRKLLAISGFPLSPGPLKNNLEAKGYLGMCEEIITNLEGLDICKLSTSQRIKLIDTAVKAGNVNIVKEIAEKFIKAKADNEIRIPSKENPEYPYRPTFWLASIQSRQPGTPVENYKAIEAYLCERFNIGTVVMINGRSYTREAYLKKIETWKHEQNLSLFSKGVKRPRYRRHLLLDAIEVFDKSKLSHKK